jgi:hypothetical protein
MADIIPRSDGLGGRPGTRWRNPTNATWYQLVGSLRKPCADCLRRHGRVSPRPWPIPFHPHCECEQLLSLVIRHWSLAKTSDLQFPDQ